MFRENSKWSLKSGGLLEFFSRQNESCRKRFRTQNNSIGNDGHGGGGAGGGGVAMVIADDMFTKCINTSLT